MTVNRERPNRRKKIEAESPSTEAAFAHPAGGGPQIDGIVDPQLAAVPGQGWDDLSKRIGVFFDPEAIGQSQTPGSGLQKALFAATLAVAAVLAYTVARKMQGPPAMTPSPPPASATIPRQPTEAVPQQASAQEEEPAAFDTTQLSVPAPEPVSLQLAERFYLGQDFDAALATYDRLCRRVPVTEENQAVRDFLVLRMALCARCSGNTQQADSMFRVAALSRFPVLRAVARYYQSMDMLDRQRYLEAATRVYQTMALIELTDRDAKWSASVQQECGFLAAEALTRNCLSLRDADTDLPKELWIRHTRIDPFVHLDEAQLKALLDSGCRTLELAALSPQIRPVGNGTRTHWSVTCNGASLEELLARLAGNAGVNIRWLDTGRILPDEEAGRKRPVYLHLRSATLQQVVTVAAGSVGLMARMDAQGNITVADPSSYSSLAEHTRLLGEESVSLWQRFLLGAEEDQKTANGHFALGLLCAAADRADEAIAEYKLVANRFARHALAPHALLRSGRLKVRLRDYVGAHEDFKQLIELYPDAEFSDQACLELADATMKAGRYEEAAGLYRKVFNLGLSAESQTRSALGAGRCFHEMKDHPAAAQWLNRYVSLAQDQDRAELHSACLLLGKTYLALNNPERAQTALALALKGELSRQQHVEAISALLNTYVQQELFVEALNLLEGTQAWQLSQQEMIELLVVRAKVLRSIGLVEKAIALLAQKSPFLPDPRLKAIVALELAECYAARGDPASAIEALGKAFASVEPGDLAVQVGCRLAELCLRENRPEQTVSVCSQLLGSATGGQRGRLLSLQAEACRMQKQYDRAVTALLSEYGNRAAPTPAGFDNSSPIRREQ